MTAERAQSSNIGSEVDAPPASQETPSPIELSYQPHDGHSPSNGKNGNGHHGNGPGTKTEVPVWRRNVPEVSPQSIDGILSDIALGHSINDACEGRGVPLGLFFCYVENTHEIKARLETARNASNLSTSEEAVEAIRLNFRLDWRAAAWWLERTNPERFGKRDSIKVENVTTGQLPEAVAKRFREMDKENQAWLDRLDAGRVRN